MAFPAIALGAMAGLQLFQGFAQAAAIRQQAEYQSRMNDINARYAEMKAKETISIGEEEAVKYGKKVRGFVGSQRATLAAQGIDIGTGDAAKIIEETRLSGSQNVAKIRSNAFRESLGFISESQELERRGRMGRSTAAFEANQTLLAAGIRAGMTAYQAFGSKGD